MGRWAGKGHWFSNWELFLSGPKEGSSYPKGGPSLLSLLWNVPIDLFQRSAYKLISDSIYFSARTNHHRKSAFKGLHQSEPEAQGRSAGHWKELWSGRIGGEAGRNLNGHLTMGPGRDSRHPEDVVSRSWVGTLCVVSISATAAGLSGAGEWESYTEGRFHKWS